MEKIIETKICKCGAKFDITDKDLEFYEKVSPVFGGIKYSIPSPTLCPDCRNQRRLSFRNERKLYKRKCDLTGKEVISLYSSNSKYIAYDSKEWRSDNWNPLDYGRNYDFSKTFFEQFNELLNIVPDMSLIQDNNENSQYTNDSFQSKNCYYLFTSNTNEDCCYGNSIFGCKNSLEVLWGLSCTNCFQIIKSTNCSGCFYGLNITNCSDCFYITNCNSCSNCSFCVELNNQKYKILNIQYSKEDYEEIMNQVRTDSKKLKEMKEEYKKLLNKIPRKNLTLIGCENVIGDQIENGKNSVDCFDCFSINDCKYLYSVGSVEDTYDSNITGTLDRLNYKNYEGMSIAGMNESGFNITCWFGDRILYSRNCFYSSNLFGCVGLRNKEYCILNKQYTKEEYEELVPKIIEHMKKNNEWGEFFPSSISPFGYNETVASEYFPLNKDEAIARGFKWSDYEAPFPKVDKTIPASKLPDDIKDIPDDILNWAIECEVSKKPFRIIKQELEFYRKHGLPIPKRHPDIRHLDRMALRNPRKIFDRKCDKCMIDIKTTYSPDRPEIVYCEECYHKEVY